jgi:hypothetical protein
MTWDSIINSLGGTGAVAAELSLGDPTVSGWRKRGIPAAHWGSVVALAARCGRSEIALEALAELAARKRAGVLEEARQ